MIFQDKFHVALDSMGFLLDNVDNDSAPQFMFMPVNGSVVFNPNNGLIETYSGTGDGCHVASSRSPEQFELYGNIITQRIYEWDGAEMVEADLTTELSEDPIIGDTSFSEPNTVYHITSVISGTVVIGSGSTLVFHDGGRFVNCTLTGENVKVIPNGEQTIFENCNFTNCSFYDSEVCATNFGAVADMWAKSIESFSLKDLPIQQIYEHKGTNNWAQFQDMAFFLSNSCRIKLHFNGSFYISTEAMITIEQAQELEIFGDVAEPGQHPPCKLIIGIELKDCVDVSIHDLSFVGFHLPHDFPTILTSGTFRPNLRKHITNPDDPVGKMAYDEYLPWVNRLIHNMSLELIENNNINLLPFDSVEQYDETIGTILANYTYNIVVDGAKNLGLANNGVMAYSKSGMAAGMHVWVDHCHFEMRQTCICGLTNNARDLGPNEELKEMFDMQGTNCTFSHIYNQPLASHCHGTFFENCSGDYVFQPIDWSECANHSRARNCHFTNCVIGPKQEHRPGRTEVNYRNTIEDCSFEISDPFWTLGMKQFILQSSQGAMGDTMTVRNSSFKVIKRHPYYGIFCRSWRTLFVGGEIQIGYAPDEAGNNSELATLENLFYKDGESTPIETPLIELNHFELKAYAKLRYLFRYNIQAIVRNSTFTLSQPAVSCFEMLRRVSVNSSVFTFGSGLSYFAVYCPEVTVENSTIGGGPITFCLHHIINTSATHGGATVVYDFAVRNSVFANVTTFVYLGGNTNLNLYSNDITNNALIYNALNDSSVARINMNGNLIRLRNQAFQNVSSNLFATEFLVANNFFTSSTVQRVLSDTLHTEYADRVYNNFFFGKVVPLNEGSTAYRPLHPWNGMIYYNVSTGELEIWNGQSWQHFSYPTD